MCAGYTAPSKASWSAYAFHGRAYGGLHIRQRALRVEVDLAGHRELVGCQADHFDLHARRLNLRHVGHRAGYFVHRERFERAAGAFCQFQLHPQTRAAIGAHHGRRAGSGGRLRQIGVGDAILRVQQHFLAEAVFEHPGLPPAWRPVVLAGQRVVHFELEGIPLLFVQVVGDGHFVQQLAEGRRV